MGRLVEVADTKLFVDERGEPSAFPLLVFHGGRGGSMAGRSGRSAGGVRAGGTA